MKLMHSGNKRPAINQRVGIDCQTRWITMMTGNFLIQFTENEYFLYVPHEFHMEFITVESQWIEKEQI